MSVAEPIKTKSRDRAKFTHDKHRRKEGLVDCHKITSAAIPTCLCLNITWQEFK